MKFSLLYLPAYDPATHGSERGLYEQILDEVDFAEREGFHRVWVAEHHVGGYGGQLPCVAVMLSALAQRTRRIGDEHMASAARRKREDGNTRHLSRFMPIPAQHELQSDSML